MNIEKIIHQLWIGPLDPPLKWMNTWKEKNPNWQYILWDNDKVFSRKWRNQHLIDEYIKRYYRDVDRKHGDVFTTASGRAIKGEKATLFAWHVIADLLRYEILYMYGGYMPGADTICLKSIDDKFTVDFGSYTVRTGSLYTHRMNALKLKYPDSKPVGRDRLAWNRYAYENASPILACKKNNKFVGQLVEELHVLKPKHLGEAVDTTGNVFMGKMIRKYQPDDLYMINYTVGADRIKKGDHSIHYAGTMKNRYKEGR